MKNFLTPRNFWLILPHFGWKTSFNSHSTHPRSDLRCVDMRTRAILRRWVTWRSRQNAASLKHVEMAIEEWIATAASPNAAPFPTSKIRATTAGRGCAGPILRRHSWPWICKTWKQGDGQRNFDAMSDLMCVCGVRNYKLNVRMIRSYYCRRFC